MNSILECLRRATGRFLSHDADSSSAPEKLFHSVVGSIHEICSYVADCEALGLSKEEIVTVLEPARAIHARSPFVQRLQNWPRGYPGDFQTIDYLCNTTPRQLDTVEQVCEWYALNCGAAQQHRNKIQRQAEMITQTILNRDHARILILACGSCPDLTLAAPLVADRHFDCVVNDVDQGALQLAEDRLKIIHDRLSYVLCDVFRLLSKCRRLGCFDLVLAGGLFDYLSDRQVNFLLKRIYNHWLNPSGCLFFTNIAQNNPYRIWMEYLADWSLRERSSDDICKLLCDAGIAETPDVDTDATGLALLVEVTKERCCVKKSMRGIDCHT